MPTTFFVDWDTMRLTALNGVREVSVESKFNIAPATTGDAMLVPDLNPDMLFGMVDCRLEPGAQRSTQLPKFE